MKRSIGLREKRLKGCDWCVVYNTILKSEPGTITYHMESCDRSIDRVSSNTDSSIIMILTVESSSDDSLYITEKTASGVFGKLKQMMLSLIEALKKFRRSISEKIAAEVRSKQMKQKIRELHAKAEQYKKEGKTTIKMTDWEAIERTISDSYDSLARLAKKICTKRYTHLSYIDADVEQFDELLERANQNVEEAFNKTIEVSVDKAMKFAENQITGKDDMLSFIDDALKDIEEMCRCVDHVESMRNIKGADYLAKRANGIRKTAIKLSKFVNHSIGRKAAKLVAEIVFIFA